MAAAPSPATGSSAAPSCPKCGASTPADARFCSSCGAPLAVGPASSGATPTPPSGPPGSRAAPVDLRERVEADRGVLKRLQLLVPGFRGYREGEDLRAADSLLRREVADRLRNIRSTVENARSVLSNSGRFTALNELAPLLADLLRLEGQVRAAEQGYTGLSPAVRIKPVELDRLYEYDYGFARAADQLSRTVAPLAELTSTSAGTSSVDAVLTAARNQLQQIDQAFRARVQVIEGIRVAGSQEA